MKTKFIAPLSRRLKAHFSSCPKPVHGCARLLITGSLALSLFISPKMAQANLIEIWGSGLVGAAGGSGKSDRDFFSWAGGGAGGVEIGARILFFSAYVDYLRFFGGSTNAHLIGLNLGGDGTIDLVGNLSLVIRAAGTYYLGSLDKGDPRNAGQPNQISGEQIKTRGIGARGGIGLRYTFLRVMSIGITPQLGYHYFFAGAGEDIRDSDENSSGWDYQTMAYLRVSIGL